MPCKGEEIFRSLTRVLEYACRFILQVFMAVISIRVWVCNIPSVACLPELFAYYFTARLHGDLFRTDVDCKMVCGWQLGKDKKCFEVIRMSESKRTRGSYATASLKSWPQVKPGREIVYVFNVK